MWDMIVIVVAGLMAVMLLLVLGAVAVSFVYVLRGRKYRQNRHAEAQETQLIQEIHRGLARMEERVEALETLMLDQGKKTVGAKQD